MYTLDDFVAEARSIVDRGLGDQQTLELLSEPLSRVIARPDCIADAEPNGNSHPERSFPIYRSENLSVMAVVWGPGSGTPIHNHNCWAMEGVISGLQSNRNYARLDNGSEPWRARLEEVDPSVVGTGQTSSLKPPPDDIHAVEIPGNKTLAIHVYGADLYKQWLYQFDLKSGEVKPFRTGDRLTEPDANLRRR